MTTTTIGKLNKGDMFFHPEHTGVICLVIESHLQAGEIPFVFLGGNLLEHIDPEIGDVDYFENKELELEVAYIPVK